MAAQREVRARARGELGPPRDARPRRRDAAFLRGEIERILAGPVEPVPFGRVPTNELRIGVIERDRSLPIRELYGRIESDGERLTRRLSELSPADAARTGLHSTLGVLTVQQAAERFVAGHLEDHGTQLAAILDAQAAVR